MSKRSKRSLLVIGLILILAAVALILWLAFFSAGSGTDDDPDSDSPDAPFTDFEDPDFPSDDDPDDVDEDDQDDQLSGDDSLPRLRQITDEPIAGYTFIQNISENPDEGTGDGVDDELGDIIRWTERATGHIWQTYTLSRDRDRVTDTTVPSVSRAYFAPGGERVIYRYLDDNNDIITYSATITAGTTTATTNSAGNLSGTFLPENITQISISPSGTELFYLRDNPDGGSVGAVSNISGDGAEVVFTSPVSGWLVSWDVQNAITMTTKPSADVNGYAYLYNLSTRRLEKIAEGDGLTVNLAPDGARVIVGNNTGNEYNLSLKNISNNSSEPLPLETLPEKCLWSAQQDTTTFCGIPQQLNGDIPDEWYQGRTPFNDQLFSLDTESTQTDQILDPDTYDVNAIDMTWLEQSPDETFISWTDKGDLNLWLYKAFLETSL